MEHPLPTPLVVPSEFDGSTCTVMRPQVCEHNASAAFLSDDEYRMALSGQLS